MVLVNFICDYSFFGVYVALLYSLCILIPSVFQTMAQLVLLFDLFYLIIRRLAYKKNFRVMINVISRLFFFLNFLSIYYYYCNQVILSIFIYFNFLIPPPKKKNLHNCLNLLIQIFYTFFINLNIIHYSKLKKKPQNFSSSKLFSFYQFFNF